MRNLLRLLIFGTMLWGTTPAQAQQPASLAHQPPAFASWQPLAPAGEAGRLPALEAGSALSRRGRHALIGGALGAVAGLAVCTVISNIADDSAAGFSTCTWKGYLLTGAVGFGVGFTVGWLL